MKRMRFERSPFCPKTLDEWLVHRADYIAQQAESEKRRLDQRSQLNKAGSAMKRYTVRFFFRHGSFGRHPRFGPAMEGPSHSSGHVSAGSFAPTGGHVGKCLASQKAFGCSLCSMIVPVRPDGRGATRTALKSQF